MRKTLDEVLVEISGLPAPELREDFLIEAADRFKPVPPEIAARPYPSRNQVPACESGVYVFTKPRVDGTMDFFYAVENPHGVSAKALAVLLQESLSGAPKTELERVSPDLVVSLFGPSLTLARDQGLRNMIRATKLLGGMG